MPKVTEPDYFLPQIEALTPGRVLSAGRTRPMLIGGVCTQSGDKGEYVVKWRGSTEFWQGSLVNELWGAFIGMELDLQIAEPVQVNVSEDFAALLQNKPEVYDWAVASIGYNFGSVYQGLGYQEIVPGQSIGSELQGQLARLFAFDVLIGNPDRRIDKPNFLTNGKDLLIYDHEMAFSFVQVLPFLRNPTPWIIPDGDMEWIERNFCYRQLKGKELDFTDFVDRFARLNGEFWLKAMEVTPQDWRNEHLATIQHQVSQVVEHKNEFATELNRVLL